MSSSAARDSVAGFYSDVAATLRYTLTRTHRPLLSYSYDKSPRFSFRVLTVFVRYLPKRLYAIRSRRRFTAILSEYDSFARARTIRHVSLGTFYRFSVIVVPIAATKREYTRLSYVPANSNRVSLSKLIGPYYIRVYTHAISESFYVTFVSIYIYIMINFYSVCRTIQFFSSR